MGRNKRSGARRRAAAANQTVPAASLTAPSASQTAPGDQAKKKVSRFIVGLDFGTT